MRHGVARDNADITEIAHHTRDNECIFAEVDAEVAAIHGLGEVEVVDDDLVVARHAAHLGGVGNLKCGSWEGKVFVLRAGSGIGPDDGITGQGGIGIAAGKLGVAELDHALPVAVLDVFGKAGARAHVEELVGVVARATIQHIIALTTHEQVVARTANECFGAGARIEAVIQTAAGETLVGVTENDITCRRIWAIGYSQHRAFDQHLLMIGEVGVFPVLSVAPQNICFVVLVRLHLPVELGAPVAEVLIGEAPLARIGVVQIELAVGVVLGKYRIVADERKWHEIKQGIAMGDTALGDAGKLTCIEHGQVSYGQGLGVVGRFVGLYR